jgi:hypothetical protein
MSARRKTPTADDHKRTAIFDSGKHARKGAAQDYPAEVDPTVIDGPLAASLHESADPVTGATTILDPPAAKPTMLGKPRKDPSAPVQAISKNDPSQPIQAISKKEPSQPIQVISKKNPSQPIQAISMKTPGDGAAQVAQPNPPTPILARPKLRAMSEVTPANQQLLGHVAPPYDPVEARARQVREYVIWGCLAVILASAIALVVWFAAL